MGGAAAGGGGFVAGFAGGAMGSVFSTPIQSIGNSLYFGDPLMTPKDYAISIATGGVMGGGFQGVSALANGKTFFSGVTKPANTGPFAIPSITGPHVPDSSLPRRSLNDLPGPRVDDILEKIPGGKINTEGLSLNREFIENGYKNLAAGTRAEAEKGVFIVTKEGVILPKGARIPGEFIENAHRSSNYGIMQNGKFIEKLRIDPATPAGIKGPNFSHFHLNGSSKHLISNWPWW